MLLGSHRFRLIAEADGGTPYRQADIDLAAFDDDEPEPLASIQRAEVEREARRFGDSLGLAVDWDAVGRLDDEMLVNAIAQVAPFDAGAKQALLEEVTLTGRADLVVQLMQFQRLAPGGADMGQTLQIIRSAGRGAGAAGRRWCRALRRPSGCLSGPILPVDRPMPKRRTAEGILPGTPYMRVRPSVAIATISVSRLRQRW